MGDHDLQYIKFYQDIFKPLFVFPFQSKRFSALILINIFHAASTLSMVLRSIGEVLALVYLIKGREEWAQLAPNATITVVCFVRMMDLILKKRQFSALIVKFDDIFGECQKHSPDPSISQRMLRKVKMASIAYLCVTTVFYLHWLLNPILRNLLQPSDTWKKDHPTIVWFPFDFQESPGYEIIYCTLSLGSTVSAYVFVTSDVLVASLCFCSCCLMRDIGERIRQVGDLTRIAVTAGEEKIWDEVDAKIANCVILHREIIRYIKEFTRFYRYSFTVTFAVETMCLSFVASEASVYTVTTTTALSWSEIFLTFSMQLLCFCWSGNMVTQCGLHIGTVTSESWSEHTSERVSWKLRMIIQRSQNPILIKAGNLFTLNMGTYKKLIGIWVSTFLLLQQVTISKY